MAMKILREADARFTARSKMKIAVIGYGNQGRAHALNLRDSGFEIAIGQRPGGSAQRAQRDRQRQAEKEKRIDEILAKVHDHGMDSLTPKELKMLRSATERKKHV